MFFDEWVPWLSVVTPRFRLSARRVGFAQHKNKFSRPRVMPSRNVEQPFATASAAAIAVSCPAVSLPLKALHLKVS